MARIYPFKAIRALPEHVTKFVASAYDSDIQEEVFHRQKNNPYSYLHILNPQVFEKQPLSEEERLERSREKLNELIKEGILIEEDDACLYMYRQVKHTDTFTALIGRADLNDYRDNSIKKHENTRTDKEEGIVKYFRHVGINASPVLLTYHDNAKLSMLIHELAEPAPSYHFTADDGSEHMLWSICDQKDIAAIQQHFADIKTLYIADGHHRCAALNELNGRQKTFMACYIADSQVKIHSFSRYITDLAGMSREDFLKALSRNFAVEKNELRHPEPMPGKMDFYMGGQWYSLRVPESLKSNQNPKEKLDVYIVDTMVFRDILKVEDIRTSERVMFVNGDVSNDVLVKPVDAGRMAAVFCLNPVDIREVFQVSDFGEVMPPKSTWIEPKLQSGLLIDKLF